MSCESIKGWCVFVVTKWMKVEELFGTRLKGNYWTSTFNSLGFILLTFMSFFYTTLIFFILFWKEIWSLIQDQRKCFSNLDVFRNSWPLCAVAGHSECRGSFLWVFANGCLLALTFQWLLIREKAWVLLLTHFNTQVCFLQQKVPFFSLTYIQSFKNELTVLWDFWHMSSLHLSPSEVSGALKDRSCWPHSSVVYTVLVGESKVVERGQNWGPLGLYCVIPSGVGPLIR